MYKSYMIRQLIQFLALLLLFLLNSRLNMATQGVIIPPNVHFKLEAVFLAAFLAPLSKISQTNLSCEAFSRVASRNVGNSFIKMDEQFAMVEKNGTKFVVRDQAFYVNGFNAYWLMVFAADHSTRGKVSEVFRQASSVGLNVCRTWAFNDAGWRALQKSPSVYDEEVFEGLDFVVSEARKHGMRLLLSFCNNWEDYGGKAQYVRWGKEAGLNLTSDDEFFTDPVIKGYYKDHVMRVLTRMNIYTNVMYKDDPTIFAWELMNEPRCLLDPSGDALQGWIEEMASFIKSIDQKHLLEIGSEGFYGPSTPDKLQLNPSPYMGEAGTDFIRNHQTPGIDFASVHIYSDSWLSDSFHGIHIEFVESWMQDHIDDAEVLNTPVVFGEFGVSLKDERFDLKFRDVFIRTVQKMLIRSWRRGGAGGGSLLWQLFPEGTEHMHDGYAVVLTESASTSCMLSLHSEKIQSTGKNSNSYDDDLMHNEL